MSDAPSRLNAALEGRYNIERELGEGGMATVYLARDERHNRHVALKVLKPELAAVVGAERFLAEIETTAALQHPHILPLFDSGEADGFLFYVMPYVEGETLRERIDRDRQLPVDEAVGIATAVAGALQAAHEQGVVHRDIKPGNILLSRGQPLVADFGIALAVSAGGGGRLTETGLSLGTPYYMSPEQATGDQAVGPASDTFALACVLYEMLTGEPPYPGSTAQAVLGKIIQGQPVSATAVRRSVPANVDAAIRKALEKLPADRFTRAEDFVQALGDPSFRHGDAEAAGAASGRRSKLVGWTGWGAAAALAAVLAWTSLRPAPPSPEVRFEVTLPEGVEGYGGTGINLDVAPDGSSMVFSALSGGGDQIWIRRFDELEPSPVAGTSGGRNPRFSPDGRSLAFTADGRLTVVELSGSPPLTLVAEGVSDLGLAWADDGWIYFSADEAGLARVHQDGGEVQTYGRAAPIRWVSALPGGRGVVFTRDHGPPSVDSIAVLLTDTGVERTLVQGAAAIYSLSGHLLYTSDQDGTVFAVPFDPERMEITGPTRTIMSEVQVNAGSASYMAISRSGAFVYRTGIGSRFVPTWVGRDGSREVLDVRPGDFGAPEIAPDGRRIAFEHQPVGENQNIWVYDSEVGTLSRLTFGDGTDRYPFWSPDGAMIGYTSERAAGQADLYARRADLSAEPVPLVVDSFGAYEGQWTPDGSGIVYRRATIGSIVDSDIWYASMVDPDASRPLVATEANERNPDVSPDGRWLAYWSDESGQPEVYVRPFTAEGGRVQVSVEGGRNPVWLGDSRRLVYVVETTFVIREAVLRLDEQIVVERREDVFGGDVRQTTSAHPPWDVTPDGERLLDLSTTRESLWTGRYVVIQGFDALLRGAGR